MAPSTAFAPTSASPLVDGAVVTGAVAAGSVAASAAAGGASAGHAQAAGGLATGPSNEFLRSLIQLDAAYSPPLTSTFSDTELLEQQRTLAEVERRVTAAAAALAAEVRHRRHVVALAVLGQGQQAEADVGVVAQEAFGVHHLPLGAV